MTARQRSPAAVSRLPAPASVIWQEVEYGSYAADLPLWNELAAEADGPILELGCGVGRVALHLATRGHEVWGIDVDAERLGELGRRAREAGLAVRAMRADARQFSLPRSFALILAPMQLAELLGTTGHREMLHAAAGHIAPGGIFAIAILDLAALATPGERHGPAPLPDVRERDGWVFSSLPFRLTRENDTLQVERLRQIVSPDGELREEVHITWLDLLSPADLIEEARAAGLQPAGRHDVPASDSHVGSTIVILEASR